MQETHCPICHASLEAKEVSPCDDCGGDPAELQHLEAGRHTYTEYEVFPDLKLVLCDFCAVDFGSYDPAYFGLPNEARLGLRKMNLLKQIESPAAKIDKFCPQCGHRLSFLRFVAKAREAHHDIDI